MNEIETINSYVKKWNVGRAVDGIENLKRSEIKFLLGRS